ncbi:hypothetical protein [Tsukamurella pseudospumae]|uniref:Uncharacterized protein n=1 Tax=Tsukamurella pseudospumae TaxID=239498 RepID=A0A137ZJX8_9ACTN|nr:hypothetical protein [Tsukamurella pseudospumae]KXO98494.1 hypothetical protein AXK61_02530 [Tsukamurella pseudospumae]
MTRQSIVRVLATAAAVVLAVLGIGVVLPGPAGTASACSCGYAPNEPIPTDLVVVRGVVEKQQVGSRYVDLQVRVTSMYGAPPERVTVIRAEAATNSSCGGEFQDGQTIRMVVERGGPRWEYPTCANAVFGRSDAPDFTGTPPGPGAEEHRLPGPPMSWLLTATQSWWSLPVVAVLIVGFGLAVAALRRVRRA